MSHNAENAKGQRFSTIKFKWTRASHLWRNCRTATSLFCDLYVSRPAARSDLFSRHYYYYLRLLPWLGKNPIVSTRFGTSTANINYECTNKWEREKRGFTSCLLNIWCGTFFWHDRRSIFVATADRSTTDKDESPKCLTQFRDAFVSLLRQRRRSSITDLSGRANKKKNLIIAITYWHDSVQRFTHIGPMNSPGCFCFGGAEGDEWKT